MITMKQSTLPTIVVIITAVMALLVFISIDHSGLSVNDCTLQNNDDSYNFTCNLLVGRHFNHLQCNYTIYSENNTIIKEGSSDFKNINMGSFPINDVFTYNNNLKPYKVDVTVYSEIKYNEEGVNKTRMENSYNKTFIFN